MSSRRGFLQALCALPTVRLLRSQQTSPPTFSTDVNVVNVLATVHDKDGHIVNDLSKEDFTLEEDGRPETIRYFARDTDLPLTLGLLVDTSGSQRRVIGEERTASYHFFEQVLREDKDKAFLIHFDHEVELLQDLTSSRQKLEKALDELQVAQPRQGQGGGGGNSGGGGYPGGGGGYPGGGGGRRGGGGGYRGAGTTLYDSILLASDELMKKQQGRKALILLTDGVDHGSKVTMTEAIEKAQRSDSLVYSILFSGQEGGGFGGFGMPGMGRRGGMSRYPQQQGPDGKKVLQRISQETGGGFFEVSHKQPIDKIYERIQEELRNQYSLGYTSDQPNTEGGFRRISLTTTKKGLIVQAREGYYPAAAPQSASH
jgi:VWFA-related protein